MKQEWLLWQDIDRSPWLNMSIDELLLEECGNCGLPLLRIYGWDRKSVSIGYVQDYNAAPQEGYAIVRRPTGGGVVFHDVDLTYTVVIPQSHPICAMNRIESYHVLHRAVKLALDSFGHNAVLAASESGPVDRATMQCFTTPTRYDVLCEDRKFAGSAQRRTRNGILHQGSISADASGGNHEILAAELIKAFEKELDIRFTEYKLNRDLLEKAGKLAEDKYATDEWNRFKRVP